MANIIELGSLYLDGESIAPEAKYQPGQAISFGEAVSDMAISWVPVNGLLIADRCLLTHISWNDLDAQCLVFGKEVKIQGFRFTARLLKVGSEEDVPNEWDDALDTVGEDNAFWHWGERYFWGQESVSWDASIRAYRGYDSARYWDWHGSSNRNANLGFRPALEPLPTDHSDLRYGQAVMAIGRNGCVVGELVDKTQYDFIIRSKDKGIIGAASFLATMRDGILAVDRSEILNIAAA